MQIATSHNSSLDDRFSYTRLQGVRKQVEVCVSQPFSKNSSSRNKDFFTAPRIVIV